MGWASAPSPDPSRKWHPWFESGGYISNEDSRSESALFAPFWQSATALVFTDLRGKLFKEADYEGNVAVGLRVMRPSGWNFGAWAGWDHRRSEFDNTFNQVSFGFEALHRDWDVRVNGYVPTKDEAFVSRSDSFAALLTGSTLFVQQTTNIVRELALHGVDGEVGFRVPLERMFGQRAGGLKDRPGPARRKELRLYAGGFFFDNDDLDDEVAGPRGRIEFRIDDIFQRVPGSRLTLEGEYRYDDARDHQLEAGARLRIPFGFRGREARHTALASLNGQERRMMEGLERDTDVVATSRTDTTTQTEAAIDNATDVALNTVAFVADGGDLQAALDGAGQNSLTIVTGGTLNGNVTLQQNQTLQGGGSTIEIRGAKSGQVVPFMAPGTRPTIREATNAVLTVADRTHVAGVSIQGNGGGPLGTNFGILGGDNQFVAVTDATITGVGDRGISFGNNNTVTIVGTNISNVGDDGVFMLDGNTATVRNSTISGAVDIGIGFRENNTVAIRNTTIASVGGDGVLVESDHTLTIESVTLRDIGGEAIDVQANNVVSISNTTFTGIFGRDVFEFDGAGNQVVNSTGNVNSTTAVGNRLCDAAAGAFSGTIGFVDGTVLQDDVAPCN